MRSRRSGRGARRRGEADVDAAAGRRSCSRSWRRTIVRGDDPRDRHAHRRARPRRPCGRSSARSASCRARMARRCSPAARPRRWWSTTLGTGEDEQYHRFARRHVQASTSCCTTTSRPTRSARPAASAGAGRREIGHGKLAWRAIHPMLPPTGRVPLHDPRRLGDHRVERLVLDGDRLRRVAGADGCGRAAEARRSPASPWA